WPLSPSELRVRWRRQLVRARPILSSNSRRRAPRRRHLPMTARRACQCAANCRSSLIRRLLQAKVLVQVLQGQVRPARIFRARQSPRRRKRRSTEVDARLVESTGGRTCALPSTVRQSAPKEKPGRSRALGKETDAQLQRRGKNTTRSQRSWFRIKQG